VAVPVRQVIAMSGRTASLARCEHPENKIAKKAESRKSNYENSNKLLQIMD
jgi:hypothetical protein